MQAGGGRCRKQSDDVARRQPRHDTPRSGDSTPTFVPTMPNSVVSIDSYFSSDLSDDEEYRIAQQEWEESLEQLAQIVSVVLLPFLGRWLGRRWSYWGMFMIFSPLSISVVACYIIAYARYVRLGLGRSFFLGERTAASEHVLSQVRRFLRITLPRCCR
jgi:MIM2-like protein